MIYRRDQLGSAREVSAAVASGALHRAGRYYVTPDAAPDIRSALAAGLRPTCLTAAREHGLWVPPGSGVHAYGRRRPDTHGWHQSWPEEDPIASPGLLLRHAAVCLDPLDVGILADSILHHELLEPGDVHALEVPRAAARVLARASGKAQSGTETKVRLFFQLRNVPVTPQAYIPGVGHVDNLVGRRWIIESDSRSHHTGEDTYAEDRRRDLRSLQLGYFTSRLTYAQVFHMWGATSRTLLEVVRSGRHLQDPARYAL